MPKRRPRAGKAKTAIMLKRKTVLMALVTSSSSALITGATAAMAEPPQMEVPTPINVVALPETLSNFPAKKAVTKTAVKVNAITARDIAPTFIILKKFISKPRRIIEYCSSFFEVNFTPSPKEYLPNCRPISFGKISDMSIPARIAVIGPPISGKVFPINHEGKAIAKQRTMPKILFMVDYNV
jgi:hypothetical protein